ncbi:MAG: hypothetical protein RRB12_10775 [Armatimonadota bacterium]|nr:hypothetical protein [Armatimonadota bacterium]
MNWTPVQTDGSRVGESDQPSALSPLSPSANCRASRRKGREALNFWAMARRDAVDDESDGSVARR